MGGPFSPWPAQASQYIARGSIIWLSVAFAPQVFLPRVVERPPEGLDRDPLLLHDLLRAAMTSRRASGSAMVSASAMTASSSAFWTPVSFHTASER
jgi:hypothetical protein